MSEYCAEKGSALMCMWERPLTFVPLYTALVALIDGYRSSLTPDSNELWIRINSSGTASAVSSAKTNLVSLSTVSSHCISSGHVQRRLCTVKHREIFALLTQALESLYSQSIRLEQLETRPALILRYHRIQIIINITCDVIDQGATHG